MGNIVLDAQMRVSDDRAKEIRNDDKLPAVVYGHGFESITVVLDYQAVRKAYMEADRKSVV